MVGGALRCSLAGILGRSLDLVLLNGTFDYVSGVSVSLDKLHPVNAWTDCTMKSYEAYSKRKPGRRYLVREGQVHADQWEGALATSMPVYETYDLVQDQSVLALEEEAVAQVAYEQDDVDEEIRALLATSERHWAGDETAFPARPVKALAPWHLQPANAIGPGVAYLRLLQGAPSRAPGDNSAPTSGFTVTLSLEVQAELGMADASGPYGGRGIGIIEAQRNITSQIAARLSEAQASGNFSAAMATFVTALAKAAGVNASDLLSSLVISAPYVVLPPARSASPTPSPPPAPPPLTAQEVVAVSVAIPVFAVIAAGIALEMGRRRWRHLQRERRKALDDVRHGRVDKTDPKLTFKRGSRRGSAGNDNGLGSAKDGTLLAVPGRVRSGKGALEEYVGGGQEQPRRGTGGAVSGAWKVPLGPVATPTRPAIYPGTPAMPDDEFDLDGAKDLHKEIMAEMKMQAVHGASAPRGGDADGVAPESARGSPDEKRQASRQDAQGQADEAVRALNMGGGGGGEAPEAAASLLPDLSPPTVRPPTVMARSAGGALAAALISAGWSKKPETGAGYSVSNDADRVTLPSRRQSNATVSAAQLALTYKKHIPATSRRASGAISRKRVVSPGAECPVEAVPPSLPPRAAWGSTTGTGTTDKGGEPVSGQGPLTGVSAGLAAALRAQARKAPPEGQVPGARTPSSSSSLQPVSAPFILPRLTAAALEPFGQTAPPSPDTLAEAEEVLYCNPLPSAVHMYARAAESGVPNPNPSPGVGTFRRVGQGGVIGRWGASAVVSGRPGNDMSAAGGASAPSARSMRSSIFTRLPLPGSLSHLVVSPTGTVHEFSASSSVSATPVFTTAAGTPVASQGASPSRTPHPSAALPTAFHFPDFDRLGSLRLAVGMGVRSGASLRLGGGAVRAESMVGDIDEDREEEEEEGSSPDASLQRWVGVGSLSAPSSPSPGQEERFGLGQEEAGSGATLAGHTQRRLVGSFARHTPKTMGMGMFSRAAAPVALGQEAEAAFVATGRVSPGLVVSNVLALSAGKISPGMKVENVLSSNGRSSPVALSGVVSKGQEGPYRSGRTQDVVLGGEASAGRTDILVPKAARAGTFQRLATSGL